MKTCLYNFDPLKPHFCIVKLGFTEVNIILSLLKNTVRWYSLEPPLRGGSNEYPESMFWAEIWKISEFYFTKTFHFLEVKFSLSSAIYQCLQQIPKEDYLSAFRDWVKRLQRYVSVKGEYFEDL